MKTSSKKVNKKSTIKKNVKAVKAVQNIKNIKSIKKVKKDIKKIKKVVLLKKVKKTKVKINLSPKVVNKPKAKIKTKAKVQVKAKAQSTVKPKTKTKTKTKVIKNVKVKAKKEVKVKPVNKILSKKSGNKEKMKYQVSVFGPVDIVPYTTNEDEDYMNDQQLEHFKTILLKWKEQLMEDVDITMHHMQDEAANYPDPVDRASQEEEFSLELRTRDRERKLLKKIDETLMRINDGDYGYCDDCGAEVGVRRLEARPTATQCIECKTIAELREKQVGENN